MIAPTYRSHKIEKRTQVRLVPPSDLFPDCVCELVLTDRTLFVLEDNYDSTYTEHFIIAVNKIKNMNIQINESGEGSLGAPPNQSTAALIAELVLGAIAGIYVLRGGNTGKRVKQKYLRIDYLNEWGKEQSIYFIELDRRAKKLVDYWKKKKDLASNHD